MNEPAGQPVPADRGGAGEARARLERRRALLRWIVPLILGASMLAMLGTAFLTAGTLGVALTAAALAVSGGILGMSRLRDRRRREAIAPVDPVLRARPPLDLARVRSEFTRAGSLGALVEVRRQAPWLSIEEAGGLVNEIARGWTR